MHFSLPAQLQTATSTADSEASGRMKKDVMGSIVKKLKSKSKKTV